jgi:hypothetical protein
LAEGIKLGVSASNDPYQNLITRLSNGANLTLNIEALVTEIASLSLSPGRTKREPGGSQ